MSKCQHFLFSALMITVSTTWTAQSAAANHSATPETFSALPEVEFHRARLMFSTLKDASLRILTRGTHTSGTHTSGSIARSKSAPTLPFNPTEERPVDSPTKMFATPPAGAVAAKADTCLRLLATTPAAGRRGASKLASLDACTATVDEKNIWYIAETPHMAETPVATPKSRSSFATFLKKATALLSTAWAAWWSWMVILPCMRPVM